MPYPSISDVETAAHQLGVDPRAVFSFAAVNQLLPVNTGAALAFQQQGYSILNAWQLGGASALGNYPLDKSVTIDLLWAYTNQYGSFPPSPSALTGWGQGAGYVNSQGIQIVTPSLGANYPPSSIPTAQLGQTGTVAPLPSGAPVPGTTGPAAPGTFDFNSFFGMVTSNPSQAISTYPIPAALTVLGGLFVARKLHLHLPI